ncbi:unnamed protein product [Toxocara canis]|uniref:ATP synthase subunit d, mitochondrial n=1 Tax=Toxocara canis TaxID=6265 RepID=A0A183UI59_TOXCA|nr:unnamed protein product [Toxocara canis]
MAASGKRVMKAAVNWKQVTDQLIPKHAAELSALKGQYSQFFGSVVTRPADLPKYDFEALKKQMPDHLTVLDSLQKQYESLKIPYGKIPDAYLKV